MKKLFALICACVFVGSMASAQWLVYDYKASIKRLDSQITKIKWSPEGPDSTSYMQTDPLNSFKVVTDSFTGFLVIPICSSCGLGSAEYSVGYPQSYIYIKRGGDKTNRVWKFEPEVAAGLFNSGVAAPEDLGGSPTSYKKLKGAWMAADWSFDQYPMEYVSDGDGGWTMETADPLFANYAPYGYQQYGFLGFASVYGDWAMTGFGSAAPTVSEVFCGGSNLCFVINSISGGILGWDWKDGICGAAPSWDLCTLLPVSVEDSGWYVNGVSHGSWSIKLNSKVTAEFNNQTDQGYPWYDADFVLVKKLVKNASSNAPLLYDVPELQTQD